MGGGGDRGFLLGHSAAVHCANPDVKKHHAWLLIRADADIYIFIKKRKSNTRSMGIHDLAISWAKLECRALRMQFVSISWFCY